MIVKVRVRGKGIIISMKSLHMYRTSKSVCVFECISPSANQMKPIESIKEPHLLYHAAVPMDKYMKTFWTKGIILSKVVGFSGLMPPP